MTPPAIQGRVFIVGVPRSGTTLLQGLLAAHGATTSFTESHFFARHFSRLPGTSTAILTRNPAPRVAAFLTENGEEPRDVAAWFSDRDRRLLQTRFALPFQSRSVARQLLRVFDELALRRGLPCWIEKTPRHLRYIPFLERVSSEDPRPQFVHMIRDGMEVVASLYEASQSWERSYDLETCIRRWNEDVAFSLSRVASPSDHFVFYEQLTSRPEATLRRLLAELGLSWEPEILESYGRTTERLVTGEERWKADVGRPIRHSATSHRVLNAAQRDRVTHLLRQDLYLELVARVQQRAGGIAATG
jgi:hypothetical protein